MTYLFGAFAAVWVGIFLDLYALIRRSQMLVWEVEVLRDQLRKDTSPTPSAAVGSRGGRS